MISVGIDTGGTFTDVAAYDPESGAVTVAKVPSTPDRPDDAVLQALGGLGQEMDGVERLIYGTTVATNALIERRGARLALITTEGFRDTLEIGRTRRAAPGLFDTKATRPEPLVPRPARFEVAERMLPDGSVRRRLDPSSVSCILRSIESLAPQAIVVCLLHSYANSAHEHRVRSMVNERFPGLPVQLSAELLPEYREYERLSTAVINAYVLPLMSDYLTRLADELQLGRRRLFVMSSNGGTMTAARAATEPARTFLSGPAGGVQAAILVGRAVGLEDLITCDMGGTSTDVSLVRGRSAAMVKETMIAGLPLKLSQLDINTVGAGGGSIAWVDVDGALAVGPRSAGAVPGPACYGRGGEVPTVTDASLQLGRLGSETLFAGGLRLDPALARQALDRLAREAAVRDPDQLAEGVLRLAVARMVGAIREISVERGYDPREAVLVAMGGAGPMYAATLASEIGIHRVLVPSHPGNMSAIGLLAADIRYDLTRTWIVALSDLALPDLRAALEPLREEGAARLSEDGFDADRMRLEPAADVRYRGQAFELTVPLSGEPDPNALHRDFEALYEARYGFRPQGHTLEVVALRMAAIGSTPPFRFDPHPVHVGSIDGARKGTRRVYFDGTWHDECPIYDRARLGASASTQGPAIIEEFGATTVLPPGWRARVDSTGHIFMEHG